MQKDHFSFRNTVIERLISGLLILSALLMLSGSVAFNIAALSGKTALSPFTAGSEEAFAPVGKNISDLKDMKLIPGGMPFGVKLYTKGVIVVGLSDVDTGKGRSRVAEKAGMRVGDVIEAIDGKAVDTVSSVSALIEGCGGKELDFSVDREGEKMNILLTPEKSAPDGIYKAGLWIRDSTSGIGTVTYIDPEDLTFAGLGHGICDVDTALLMPLSHANVLEVRIDGSVKGKVGDPGELKGVFEPKKIGVLTSNTQYGVFGKLNALPDDTLPALPVATSDEVKTGKAEIRCTVDDVTEFYGARIVRKNKDGSMQKNFIIEITDERLIAKTGGIVQGMSGSPVIQDGKIVGAVTHVMINDPKRGYGIYIENMLKNAA